jgi:aminoglycoside phosphotransferase (APT) family kinase protein
MSGPDPELRAAVARLLHADARALRFTAQSGGVSSDIWRVDSPAAVVCAKRALAKLKVADDWRAPTRRNAEEAKWLRFAATVVPKQVPRVIAHDAADGVLVLEWFDPSEWRNWKSELLAERIDPRVGAALGAMLGRVHAASSGNPTIPNEFANLELFEALRIQPYFATAAQHNRTVAAALGAISTQLRSRARALVHGDVSPKNVLVSTKADPVLLDAECATWGDPTFDVSFMLSHLMLKAIHRRAHARDYLATASAFFDAYAPFAGTLLHATPSMTAALLLARIDGKSPVEYLDGDAATRVHAFAIATLREPPRNVSVMLNLWASILAVQ